MNEVNKTWAQLFLVWLVISKLERMMNDQAFNEEIGALAARLEKLPKNIKNFAVKMGEADNAFELINDYMKRFPGDASVAVNKCNSMRKDIQNDVIDFDENLFVLSQELVRKIYGDMTILSLFSFEQWNEMKQYMQEKDEVFLSETEKLIKGSDKFIKRQREMENKLSELNEILKDGGNMFQQTWTRFMNNFRSKEDLNKQDQVGDLLYGENSAPKILIGVTKSLREVLVSFKAYFSLIKVELEVVSNGTAPPQEVQQFELLKGHAQRLIELCESYLMCIPDASAQLYSIGFMREEKKKRPARRHKQ